MKKIDLFMICPLKINIVNIIHGNMSNSDSTKDSNKEEAKDNTTNIKELARFNEFLENNISTLVICPITYCTFFDPVVGSDGFIYEKTAFKELCKSYPKSPVTREKLDSVGRPISLITNILKHIECYELEACSNKYITDDSFEDNVDIICDLIETRNYEQIKKFTKFTLGFKCSGGKLFSHIISTQKFEKEEEGLKYLDVFRYIIDHSTDIDFIVNKTNILHIALSSSMYIHIMEYIMDKLKTKNKLIEYSIAKDQNDKTPIDYGLKRDKLVLNCMKHYQLITHETIIGSINSLVKSNSDEAFTIEMLEHIKDINQLYNGENLINNAIRNNRKEGPKYILKRGASITGGPDCCLDHNLISYIFRNTQDDMLQIILDHIDLEMEIKDGWRPFHYICIYRKRHLIDWMIEKGVTFNVPIKKFNGEDKEYLPTNMIELNQRLDEKEKEEIVDLLLTMMFDD